MTVWKGKGSFSIYRKHLIKLRIKYLFKNSISGDLLNTFIDFQTANKQCLSWVNSEIGVPKSCILAHH